MAAAGLSCVERRDQSLMARSSSIDGAGSVKMAERVNEPGCVPGADSVAAAIARGSKPGSASANGVFKSRESMVS